jgi:uncharacterized membrane protein YfcA
VDGATFAGLILAGVLAGVVNTLAGGGSLISLPALMWAGLPPQLANGTNRVAILASSATAAKRFHGDGVLNLPQDPWVWGSACVGAAVGSWLSVELDERVFRILLAVVLGGVLAMVLFKPSLWGEGGRTPAPRWVRVTGFLLIGAYGGFVQAGVGYLLLAGFVGLSGHDLVGANARKVGLVLLYTVPAMAVFVAHGMVQWAPGLVLASGAALGGWLGARVTVAWGPQVVRGVLVLSVLASTGRLLGMW